MPIPIEFLYPTGSTIYAVIHNPDGTVWNNISLQFEAFNAGLWANYAVPLAEQGASGYYSGVYPTAIGEDVLTTEVLYLQGGGAPATNDTGLSLGQTQGSSMAALNGDRVAAENLRTNAAIMAKGSAQSGTLSKTQMTTNLPSAVANAYNSRVVVFTTGTAKDQVSNIVAYNGAGLLTFGALTVAPSAGDEFLII